MQKARFYRKEIHTLSTFLSLCLCNCMQVIHILPILVTFSTNFKLAMYVFFTQIEVYAQSYPHFHTLVCITCLNIHMNYFSLLPQCIKPLSLIKPTEQKHCSAVPLLLVLADKLPNFNVVY